LSARRCLAPVNWEAETVNAAADIVCVWVCAPIGSGIARIGMDEENFLLASAARVSKTS